MNDSRLSLNKYVDSFLAYRSLDELIQECERVTGLLRHFGVGQFILDNLRERYHANSPT